MGPAAEKRNEKAKSTRELGPPSEAPSEVGLFQGRPLGLAEQPPGRRRDFEATAHVELLAGSRCLLGGCLSGGGKGSQNGRAGFWQKGVQAEAFGLRKLRRLLGAFGTVFVGEQALPFSDSVMRRSTACNSGPNLGPELSLEVGLAVERRPRFCSCSGTLPKMDAPMLRVPGPFLLGFITPSSKERAADGPFAAV